MVLIKVVLAKVWSPFGGQHATPNFGIKTKLESDCDVFQETIVIDINYNMILMG